MFKVKVYDRGIVTMCELKNGEWQDCTFETSEDALKALNDYREFTGNYGGYVYSEDDLK